jgi:broad specificity phosphatase PhoE
MASLIHMVRHGEVENPDHVVYGRLPGFGLSTRGMQQAADAGRHMATSPVVAVWSSPLQRAIETAEKIASRHALPVRIEESLTEWRLSDVWQGCSWDSLPTSHPGQLERYLKTPWDLPFSPESLEEVADRVAEVVRLAHEIHSKGEVVIVSHQDPMQAALLLLTGGTLATQHVDKSMHATVYTIKPGTPWALNARYDPETHR